MTPATSKTWRRISQTTGTTGGFETRPYGMDRWCRGGFQTRPPSIGHDRIHVGDDRPQKEKARRFYAPDPSNLNKSIFHGQVYFYSHSRWLSARRSSVFALLSSPPSGRLAHRRILSSGWGAAPRLCQGALFCGRDLRESGDKSQFTSRPISLFQICEKSLRRRDILGTVDVEELVDHRSGK